MPKPLQKVCPKGLKLSVTKGRSGGGSPDRGKVGQRKAAADDCGGTRVAGAPVGKRTAVRVKAPAGKVKGGTGRVEIGKKVSKALVSDEADVVVVSGDGATGLSSDGGGGGPVPIVGSPGTVKTRTSRICAGALEGFGSPSKEPSDEDAPRLKDPPEWGMAVAARASNAQPDTSVEEGTDEDDEESAVVMMNLNLLLLEMILTMMMLCLIVKRSRWRIFRTIA
jgi:hypothetical protein